MEYRFFGRTGIQVSPICLGCMNFGGRAPEQESIEIILHALEAGINFVDTANVYGHNPQNFSEGRGRSEQIVGKALKQSGKREQVILATKAHFPMYDPPNNYGNSRRHIIEQCHASLKRLDTDYIDLYQLHHPSNDVPIDETLRALDDLVTAGKVRYIGSSSFAAWQLVESFWVAKEYGFNRFVSEQPSYHLLDRRIERELVPMAQTYGLAIIPWSPTAGGFLTGKYKPNSPPPDDSRFAVFWRGEETRHLTEQSAAILTLLEEISQEKGCTMYEVALAWCIQQPGITSTIIGPRTMAHLEGSITALDVKFTAEDLQRIDQVAPPGRATIPYYGYDGLAWIPWGPHRFRW